MKRDFTLLNRRLWTLILTVMLVPVVSAAGQNARLRMPDLSAIAGRASNSVDITLDGALLNLAARFFDGRDENERAVKEMLGAVKGIYVKTFEFNRDGGYSSADLDAVRHQLAAPGWSRLAGVRSSRDQTQVEVYLWMDGDKPGGLAVLSAEPRNLVIVNIVGAIDLEKLRALEGQFGVPRFDLERRSKEDRKRRDDQ
jgi:Domain of unknown function (DUF4252)